MAHSTGSYFGPVENTRQSRLYQRSADPPLRQSGPLGQRTAEEGEQAMTIAALKALCSRISWCQPAVLESVLELAGSHLLTA